MVPKEKAAQKAAQTAQASTKEVQSFIDYALNGNIKKQGDLDAIREYVMSNGTSEQRKKFSEMEANFNKFKKAPSWEKYSKAYGTTYQKAPVSGVVEAERRAAEIIENNSKRAAAQLTEAANTASPQVTNNITKTNSAIKNLSSFGKKFLKYAKWGVGIGLAVILFKGIKALYDKTNNTENKVQTQATKPNVNTQNSTNSEAVNTPTNSAQSPDTTAINQQTLPDNKYIVNKNDNVWKIAKQELIEEGIENPSDIQIARRRDKIMEASNLQYEKDNYTVLIHPNDTLTI